MNSSRVDIYENVSVFDLVIHEGIERRVLSTRTFANDVKSDVRTELKFEYIKTHPTIVCKPSTAKITIN